MRELDKSEVWLSKQFENKIAKQAENLAAEYVQEYRDEQSALQSEVSLMPAQFPHPLGSPALNSLSVIPKAQSETYTDTEEIFEPPMDKNSTQASVSRQSHRSSFSPATSYSNEATEENRGDENGDLDAADSGPKHLPKRDTRAKEPLYTPLKRTRRKRITGDQVMVPSSQPRPKVIVPNRTAQHTSSRSRPEVIVPQSRTLDASPLKKVSNFRAPQLKNPVGALLREREMHGLFPIRARRGQSSFKAMFTSYLEDCYGQSLHCVMHFVNRTVINLTVTPNFQFCCLADSFSSSAK